MTETFILQGKVKWSYSYELAEISDDYKAMTSMMSFAPPLHRHNGNIALSDAEIIIEGIDDDIDLTINLSAIKQLYLGFDDVYPVTSVKSFGAFWQPLRIEYYNVNGKTETLYLVIDYNGVFTHDKVWFEKLTQILQ
jgi:hypothetical protein